MNEEKKCLVFTPFDTNDEWPTIHLAESSKALEELKYLIRKHKGSPDTFGINLVCECTKDEYEKFKDESSKICEDEFRRIRNEHGK